MNKLLEFQVDDEVKKKELVQKIIQKFKLINFKDIDIHKVSDFVNDNYDLLITDIDTISPNILVRNYIDYIQKNSIAESIKRTLREAERIEIEIKKSFLKK